MTTNRSKLARERAGLSVGQACKMLDVNREYLISVEETDPVFETADEALLSKMADFYGVNREWLAGTSPLRDYERFDAIPGADKVSFHDRDVVAEFMASMPRGTAKTLEQIKAEKK